MTVPGRLGAGVRGLRYRIRRAYYRLLIPLAGPTFRTRFRDVTAEFYVSGLDEYARIPRSGREHLEILLDHVEPDDVFWEVGACTGVISCLVGRRVSSVRVVAFEPHPENATRARENLELNGVDGTVVQKALYDAEGRTQMTVEDGGVGSGGHTLSSPGGGDVIEVPTATGDGLVSDCGLAAPNLVHVDAEGAELRVLRGMRQQLRRTDCRRVHCEVHVGGGNTIEDHGGTPGELRALLAELGFEIEREIGGGGPGDNVHVLARK